MNDSPHPIRFTEEPLARKITASSTISFGTTAPYHIGEPYFQRVGFASIPRVNVEVNCHERSIGAVVPVARQFVFRYMEALGISSDHLGFTAHTQRSYRRRRFVDQNGNGRMGTPVTIGFDLSSMAASAIDWTSYHGKLRTL